MRWLLLGLLLFAVPTQAQTIDTGVKVSLGILITAAVADAWTTEQAVKGGGIEINPVMANRSTRMIVKPAVTTALVITSCRYARRGERKRALLVALVPAAIWTAAAINNARHMR